jgi:uncharacterized membrane protein
MFIYLVEYYDYNMYFKKSLMIILVVLCFICTAIAEEIPANVVLTLKDIKSGEFIDSVVVTVKSEDFVINQFVELDDILRTNLENGIYQAEIIVDDLNTEGKDYYAVENLDVKDNLIKAIYVYPIGSIQGIVKDKLDNVINAKLRFECNTELIDFPDKTNSFGGFGTEIPVGRCRIFASYQDGIGFLDVVVEKGSLNVVEINLDKAIVNENNKYPFVLIALIILFFGTFIYFVRKNFRLKKEEKVLERKEKEVEQEVVELKAELELGKRGTDIFETLKAKEKKIVEYILKEGRTTQAKIHHELNIPKASLFRLINALEEKKIIEVKQVGRVKRIKLSKWFLGEG